MGEAQGPELRAPRGESQRGLRGPQGSQGPGPLRGTARRHPWHYAAPLRDARDRGRRGRPRAGRGETRLGEHTGGREGTGEVLPQGHTGKLAGRPDPGSGRDSGAGVGPAAKSVLPGRISMSARRFAPLSTLGLTPSLVSISANREL